MRSVRQWSVRNARQLEWLYVHFERLLLVLQPLWRKIGYARLELPVRYVERGIKGFLFDCRMCGHCVLSSTGMSCPMNCPKELRNGPCGGVTMNGRCEVDPDMDCVWVEAWNGSSRMRGGSEMSRMQLPLCNSQRGTSSWLREVRHRDHADHVAESI